MLKVLFVDDEEAVSKSVVNFLKSIGRYEVYSARNSKEAFEALKEHNPDILILDINLREEYTGVDVLKKAKELNPHAQAVMLTGLSTDDNLVDEALKYGAKKILEKPTPIRELLNTVNNLAESITP